MSDREGDKSATARVDSSSINPRSEAMKGLLAAAIYASLCAGFLTGANFTRGLAQTLLAILGGLFFFIAIWCGAVWSFAYFQAGDRSTDLPARLTDVERSRTGVP